MGTIRRDDVPVLGSEQSKRWKQHIDGLRAGARDGHVTDNAFAAAVGVDTKRVKDPLSKFTAGDHGTLRRWFAPRTPGSKPAKTAGWVDAFGRLTDTSVKALWEELLAIASGVYEAAPWHPAFPSVTVEAAEIEPSWLSALTGGDVAGDTATEIEEPEPETPQTSKLGIFEQLRSSAPQSPVAETWLAKVTRADSDVRCIWLVGRPGQGRRTGARLLQRRLGEGWGMVAEAPSSGWETWRRDLGTADRTIALIHPIEADSLDLRGSGRNEWIVVEPWGADEAGRLARRLANCEGLDADLRHSLEDLAARIEQDPAVVRTGCTPARMISRLASAARGDAPDESAELRDAWATARRRPGAAALERFGPELLVDFWCRIWRAGSLAPWTRVTRQEAISALEATLGPRLERGCFDALLERVGPAELTTEDVEEYRRRSVDFDDLLEAMVAGGLLADVAGDEFETGSTDDASVCLLTGASSYGLAMARSFARIDEAEWLALAPAIAATGGVEALLALAHEAPEWASVDAARFVISGLATLSPALQTTPVQRSQIIEAWATTLWAAVHAPYWPRVDDSWLDWGSREPVLGTELRTLSRQLVMVLPGLDGPDYSDALARLVPDGVLAQIPPRPHNDVSAMVCWLARGQTFPLHCSREPRRFVRPEEDLLDWAWIEQLAAQEPPDPRAVNLLGGERIPPRPPSGTGLDDDLRNDHLRERWLWRSIPIELRVRWVRIPETLSADGWWEIEDILTVLRVGHEHLQPALDEAKAELLGALVVRIDELVLIELLELALDDATGSGERCDQAPAPVRAIARMLPEEAVFWIAERLGLHPVLEQCITRPFSWLQEARCWGWFGASPPQVQEPVSAWQATTATRVQVPPARFIGAAVWGTWDAHVDRATQAANALYEAGSEQPMRDLLSQLEACSPSAPFLEDLREVDELHDLGQLDDAAFETALVPDLDVEQLLALVADLPSRSKRSSGVDRHDLMRTLTGSQWWRRADLAGRFAPLRAGDPRVPPTPSVAAAAWVYFVGGSDRRARAGLRDKTVDAIINGLRARVRESRSKPEGSVFWAVMREFQSLQLQYVRTVAAELMRRGDEGFLSRLGEVTDPWQDRVAGITPAHAWRDELKSQLKTLWPSVLYNQLEADAQAEADRFGSGPVVAIADASPRSLEGYIRRVPEDAVERQLLRRMRKATDAGHIREAGWLAVNLGWRVGQSDEKRLLELWCAATLEAPAFGHAFRVLKTKVIGGDDYLLARMAGQMEKWRREDWYRKAISRLVELCLDAGASTAGFAAGTLDSEAKGARRLLVAADPRASAPWKPHRIDRVVVALGDPQLRDRVLAHPAVTAWEVSELARWAVRDAADVDALIEMMESPALWMAASRRLFHEGPDQLRAWCLRKLDEAIAADEDERYEPRCLYLLKRHWPEEALEALVVAARREPAKAHQLSTWVAGELRDFGRLIPSAKRAMRELRTLRAPDVP